MKKSVLTSLLFLAITGLTFGNSWLQKADFGGTKRLAPGYFVIGNNAYVGFGSDSYPTYHFPNDFWKYNQTTDTWTQIANFPGTPVYGPIGFSIGGKGYIGCGWTPTFYNQFYEYDTLLNTWTQKNNFIGTKRTDAVSFTIGSKGYVGLGLGQANINLNDMWEYDNTTDSWTQKANFPGTARYGTCLLVIDYKAYVGLGNDAVYPAPGPRNDFYEFDPVANIWTQKASFPGAARWSMANFVIDKKGYVGLGLDGVNRRKDFWKYDAIINQWWQVADYDTLGLQETGSFNIGTKGYVVGGYHPNYNAPIKQFWEYTPDSLTTGGSEFFSAIKDISLFPNPTSGSFKISYTASIGASVVIRILDVKGKNVVSKNLTQVKGSNDFTFDLSNQARGIYFVELETNGYKTIKKLLVE